MAYRVILVPIMGDPGDQHALDVTRGLSDMVHSHIVGIHVRSPLSPAASGAGLDTGYLTAGVIEAFEQSGRERAAMARATFRQWQEATGLADATSPAASGQTTVEWNEVHAPVALEIARRARTADLTVVARSHRDYSVDADQVLQGALWESGRPVLLVPGDSPHALLDTAVVAWNNSREAAHAVSAAWSLIGRMKRIVVFVGGEDDSLRHAADRFVRHLAWRNYASATIVSDPSQDTGAGLLAVAEREKAGLIIMGAYSHSRLRHFVFGGATSFVLANATTPVLMAH